MLVDGLATVVELVVGELLGRVNLESLDTGEQTGVADLVRGEEVLGVLGHVDSLGGGEPAWDGGRPSSDGEAEGGRAEDGHVWWVSERWMKENKHRGHDWWEGCTRVLRVVGGMGRVIRILPLTSTRPFLASSFQVKRD